MSEHKSTLELVFFLRVLPEVVSCNAWEKASGSFIRLAVQHNHAKQLITHSLFLHRNNVLCKSTNKLPASKRGDTINPCVAFCQRAKLFVCEGKWGVRHTQHIPIISQCPWSSVALPSTPELCCLAHCCGCLCFNRQTKFNSFWVRQENSMNGPDL